MHDKWVSGLKRIIIVTGHYGSGKTEFSVSLAMLLAGMANTEKTAAAPGSRNPVALIDLDIVNPYFRSRERRELLENSGISVYGCLFDKEITAELPALGATIRTPLEDKSTRVVTDLGGNECGASTVIPFGKYFTAGDTMMAAVVNANRPETCSADGARNHISAIEAVTGLNVSHLINNTHMLRETTVYDIEKGHKLCREICAATGKELLCDCYPIGIADAHILAGISDNLMPLGLYMRPAWLDR